MRERRRKKTCNGKYFHRSPISSSSSYSFPLWDTFHLSTKFWFTKCVKLNETPPLSRHWEGDQFHRGNPTGDQSLEPERGRATSWCIGGRGRRQRVCYVASRRDTAALHKIMPTWHATSQRVSVERWRSDREGKARKKER